VSIEGKDYVQGCWLDWSRVREWLLAEVRDLLPQADLAPAKGDAGNGETYMLAALPVRVFPGAVPHDTPAGAWPVRLSLLIAWGCLLLGAASVALVLWGAIALSERRGAFVSAVTHELRTPLTTFRLYADLLAQGLITDEKKKEGYLNRLREESERLSHLVENVLAYARLSGPRSGGKVERVALAELVERSRERLAARAEQAGMQLVIEPPGGGVEARAAANTSAVEQILMNLVDNACKYAGRAADRRIHLQADRGGDRGLIRVRDHGPGISREEAKRLFRPFRKSAHEAASSAPGVGLGLALSRRLARDMGGDLRLEDDVKDGACFVLSLPV
jgi:signal transduction histidine kinase